MAGKPDPYEGIDFEEISEATGLAVDEIKCLKVFHISVFRFFLENERPQGLGHLTTTWISESLTI